MAVDEVNEKLLGPLGHSLDFVVAETFGQEEVSIKQVSNLFSIKFPYCRLKQHENALFTN